MRNVRVSKEKLIELARSEAKKRAEMGDVISAYIIGSVASGNPILGGTADVDLVLIHKEPHFPMQEILPLSDDFHLDIIHHSSELYDRPTELRVDPWLGPSMCEPLFVYDPHHFFERAQAGVRGRFHRADHVHERAQAFLHRARGFKSNLSPNGKWLPTYMQTLLEGANAVATLAGFPAAGRRLVLILEARIEKLGQPSLFERFIQLHGADQIDAENVGTWLAQWERTANETSVPDDVSSRIRHRYYSTGFEALLTEGRPDIIAWNLIDNWFCKVEMLDTNKSNNVHRETWESAVNKLGLGYKDHDRRSSELEIYLDDIEEYLEIWADLHGA